MNKKNYFFFSKLNFLLLITPLISLLYSTYQAQFHYDWFHTAFVAFGSEAFLLNKTLFKEIFVPYGFMKTIFHAFILKEFNHNLFAIFIFHSFCYSLGIYILTLIILNFTDYKNAIFATVIIFLIHPFTQAPWHNYLLFFLFNLFIYLRLIYKNIYSIIILPFCIFFSETFFFASILILLFDLFYERFYFRKKIESIEFIKKLLLYFIPIILFFTFIFYNNLLSDWIKNAHQAKIALDTHFKTTIVQLLILRAKEFFIWPISKFISDPQWFIFFNIILINSFYLIVNIFTEKKSKREILYISFCSIVLLYNLIHSPNIFKFSTSSIIGIATLLFFINKIKDFSLKKIIYTIIFLLSIIGFEFNKNNTNWFYVYNYQQKEYINDDHFVSLKNYKWSKETWEYLKFIDKNSLTFKAKCNIKYANNLAEDSYVSIILQKNLIFEQVLHYNWIEQKNYWSGMTQALFTHLDPDFSSRLIKHINNNEIIIIAHAENYPIIKINNNEFDFSKRMSFLKVPSHEFGNDIIIIYPKSCRL